MVEAAGEFCPIHHCAACRVAGAMRNRLRGDERSPSLKPGDSTMLHTYSALGEDAGAPPFGPPHDHVEATAGLCAQVIAAHWPIHRAHSVMLYEPFETACSESRTPVDPPATYLNTCAAAVRQLAQRPHSPAHINAKAAIAGGATETVMAMRVLVVEDDVIIGILLAEMLAGMGYDVCAIESTEADAVRAAAQYKPDMMIVDVGLGDGSGVSAVETIYRTGPVPHVFVCGDVSKVQALRPSSIFMQKPYREADLARVIQQALDAASIQ
jgi:two-component system, response regulator PdtaR